MTMHTIWHSMAWPLLKILGSLSLSLLVANLIEALNWTRLLSRFSRPLIRAGHMQDVVGASFSMAFFSGLAANTMLSEAHQQGRLTDRELVLANLFNSLPTYFLHLPTMIFVTVPFLGTAAAIYVGMTLGAAMLRSLGIVLAGRVILPPIPEGCVECQLPEKGPTWREALHKSWRRFKKRIAKICLITAPIYAAMVALNSWGFFTAAEKFIADHLSFMDWLSPKAASIVMFGMVAEFTAGLAAAGALLHGGELPVKEVVLALMLGNLLSTPMRAFRHQFPYYAGIFRPALAAKLIVYNQVLRAASLLVVALGYYFLG
ncbi:hypothetical protein [Fundidesulfovibrio terrae]|uniref:hypothetical protein n=1 Tax=Fundidesulfovibrio terrae TaxID=2922866 RepID=UPI001FAFED5A|nr:hypothetical protein [Fundidesulfovibrio terrae]